MYIYWQELFLYNLAACLSLFLFFFQQLIIFTAKMSCLCYSNEFFFFCFCFQYEQLDERSKKKTEVLKEITEMMMHRLHLDNSINLIGKLIFGSENGPSILNAVRPSGQALVDDWNCLKTMVIISPPLLSVDVSLVTFS